VRDITLNCTTDQPVNFNSIQNMILGADAGDVITVRTERKVRRKTRRVLSNGYVRARVEPNLNRGHAHSRG